MSSHSLMFESSPMGPQALWSRNKISLCAISEFLIPWIHNYKKWWLFCAIKLGAVCEQ